MKMYEFNINDEDEMGNTALPTKGDSEFGESAALFRADRASIIFHAFARRVNTLSSFVRSSRESRATRFLVFGSLRRVFRLYYGTVHINTTYALFST